MYYYTQIVFGLVKFQVWDKVVFVSRIRVLKPLEHVVLFFLSGVVANKGCICIEAGAGDSAAKRVDVDVGAAGCAVWTAVAPSLLWQDAALDPGNTAALLLDLLNIPSLLTLLVWLVLASLSLIRQSQKAFSSRHFLWSRQDILPSSGI